MFRWTTRENTERFVLALTTKSIYVLPPQGIDRLRSVHLQEKLAPLRRPVPRRDINICETCSLLTPHVRLARPPRPPSSLPCSVRSVDTTASGWNKWLTALCSGRWWGVLGGWGCWRLRSPCCRNMRPPKRSCRATTN